jgi:TRAP-type mannitol/chloroaromatic compound transport system substrate-binding protein
MAAESLYNVVHTEYNTKHAMALRELKASGTQVRQWPEEIVIAMGNAMGEVLEEMRNDSDELVARITESFIAYRSLMAEYQPHAEAAQLAARSLDFTYAR